MQNANFLIWSFLLYLLDDIFIKKKKDLPLLSSSLDLWKLASILMTHGLISYSMYYKSFPSLFLFEAQITPNLANGTSSNMFLCLDILLSTSENFLTKGFPGGASHKEPTCQCRRHKRGRFNPLVGKTP